MRNLRLFEIFLSLVILFGFSSCNKKNSSTGSSSVGIVGEEPSFAYGETFQEVELTVSDFLGDFILNIEVVPKPGDETTDSFEFYICSQEGASCLPTPEEPKFVDSLYEGFGYDYPLAKEGENEVFVRACDSSLSERVCGAWQSSSYTQASPTDVELSGWLDMSYSIDEALSEVVGAVEEEVGISFDDIEDDSDLTEVLLDEVLDNIEDQGGDVDLESLADAVVDENRNASDENSNNVADINGDDANGDDTSDDDTSDDDANGDDTSDDDANGDDANGDDANGDEGFFEGDGFNFDSNFDEEEIALVVGGSVTAIVMIPVIYKIVKMNQKRKVSAKNKMKAALSIGKPQLLTKANSEKVAQQLLQSPTLETLAQQRTALLLKSKAPSLSVADQQKVAEDLKLSRQALKERLAVDLSWGNTSDRIKKLEGIVELSGGGKQEKKVFQSHLKTYLRTVLSEIEVLDEEIARRNGTDPKDLDQKATLEEMRADRAVERDNILKLAAGQKIEGLKITEMAKLRGKALSVEIARLARPDGKSKANSTLITFFRELNELLGLVQGKRLFDKDFFDKAYKTSVSASQLNKTTQDDLGFKQLVNFSEIRLSDVRSLATSGGKTSITKKGFNVKFGLSSEGNENLASYLTQNAEGIKKLLELQKNLAIAIASKELSSK